MNSHTYKIKTSRIPDLEIELNRVNVFLGTNGTGKSKLLQEIKDNPGALGFTDVTYVEGGRTITIADSLQLDGGNFSQFSNLENAKNVHKGKRAASLVNRVKDALLLIDRIGQEINAQHSQQVTDWIANGKNGDCPEREAPPLERLFSLFSEVFPAIELRYDSNSKSLSCYKNGAGPYSPSQLSDGEKQVFSLLADIVIVGGGNRIVIADEPELNLNAGLANRLWDLIEEELSDSVFVYATHSINFAMRANVEKIYVLSNADNKITEIKNVQEIDATELPALLGSIPAILSSTKAIAIEGKENSIDSIVYRWLSGQKDTEIVPVGNCEDVKAVANKTGIWDALAPSVEILGVIDRDFKPESLLAAIESSNCLVLDYHEIESYLCEPEIVVRVAAGLGMLKAIPTINEVEAVIIAEFEKELVQIAARRVFERTNVRLGVSIERKILAEIKDRETLKTKIVEAAKLETNKALGALGEEQIGQLTIEELERCQKAFDNKSIPEILQLMPGKNLLRKICRMAGCRNDMEFARAASKHVDINSNKKISELQSKLKKVVAVPEATAI